MKIETTTEFRRKVERQIQYISKDKPGAAKNFRKIILTEIRKIPQMPLKNKKCKFFNDENIRELVVKGYSIIYVIEKEQHRIVVFAFHKWEDDLKK